MIFKPTNDTSTEQSSSAGGAIAVPGQAHTSLPTSGARTPISKPVSSAAGQRSPKRTAAGPIRVRPIFPSKDDPAFRSAPNLSHLLETKGRPSPARRRPSLEMDLVSDIGDNRAIGGGYVGALPASFAAQMKKEMVESRHVRAQKQEQERFTKIMMARMNTLEEGFRDVIHEMRDHMKQEDRSRSPERVQRPNTGQKRLRGKETYRPSTAGGDKENVDPGNVQVVRRDEVGQEGRRGSQTEEMVLKRPDNSIEPIERPASR